MKITVITVGKIKEKYLKEQLQNTANGSAVTANWKFWKLLMRRHRMVQVR